LILILIIYLIAFQIRKEEKNVWTNYNRKNNIKNNKL
jgi:hypothetical protein